MATSTPQTTDKVKFESLVNATFKVNNSTDEGRTYAIESNVAVNNDVMESINNGVVNRLSDSVMLASFSKYSGGGLNINFTSEATDAIQCDILGAINTFIANAQYKIASTPSLASL